MAKDPTAFRERFKAYKDGKSVKEIYNAGLPRFRNGILPAYQKFVEEMGPILYKEAIAQGVDNPDVAYRNMLTQLAYESNYGTSSVARKQHNYGGVGWNGKTYTTYKSKEDFAKNYVKLMNSRYKNVIGADTLNSYAKGLKELGYYEDTLENYSRNLTNMKSFAKAMNDHFANNKTLYTSTSSSTPVYNTTIAEENAKMQFQPWSNYRGTDYPINNPAPASISSWNNPQSPAYTPVEYNARQSYLRLPDIKDVIEQSIMTPRFKNGKLPGFAGGTGGVQNNISEEYIPLASNTYQPMINDAKQQVAKFAIDDYAYRIQKQHPEVTKEQLYGAYNSTPYIGSDSRKGTTVGQYWHGEDDGYGRRVMIYPRSMKSDDPEFNLQDRIQSTVLHESNHLLRDAVLGGKYTDKEREYLETAYPGVPINEAAALNAQIREKLSNVYGKGAVGEKLDATLEKVRKDKGMQNEMMFHLNNLNGYGHADKVNGQWDSKTIDAMVNSLMNVASIQNKPSRGLFYAANGKSPIHIKPANRGKFTALKKRTGHSASWFKKNGTPAQKKMAVFALNARKWSH